MQIITQQAKAIQAFRQSQQGLTPWYSQLKVYSIKASFLGKSILFNLKIICNDLQSNKKLTSGKSNVGDDSNAIRSGKRVKGKVDNNMNESIDRIGKFEYQYEFNDNNRDPSITKSAYLPNDQQPKSNSASFPDNIDLHSTGNTDKNESTVTPKVNPVTLSVNEPVTTSVNVANTETLFWVIFGVILLLAFALVLSLMYYCCPTYLCCCCENW